MLKPAHVLLALVVAGGWEFNFFVMNADVE
jgi:hypothetical protein